jgi:hypothetical protein
MQIPGSEIQRVKYNQFMINHLTNTIGILKSACNVIEEQAELAEAKAEYKKKTKNRGEGFIIGH